MASKNSFVITIGDRGAILALHKSGTIKNKIFIPKLNEELKKELLALFNKNKIDPVYILLDTIDQIYKKKTYPLIKKHDLKQLVKRDIESDADKDSLKSYLAFEDPNNATKNQKDRKWDCLFVSSSVEKMVQEWLDFLLEIPNRLIGIYMAPVESFNLFQLLKNNINSSVKETKKKNEIYCFVLQNKVSGIRQILFNNQSILFTRLISYNIDDKDFIEKYEKDIYSTFEYLKRIIPDIEIKEMEIINILPPTTLKAISAMKNVDFHFINYTPHQAATIAFDNEAISKNSNFCDLLISKSFANSKNKILKFTTPKINLLEKLFLGTKISYYANLFLLLMIGISCLLVINKINELEELHSIVEIEKLTAIQTLNKTTSEAFEGTNAKNQEEGTLEIDRILDIGKIHEILGNNEANLTETYSKFKFIKKYNVQASGFSYKLLNYNTKSPSKESIQTISIKGKILNRSGDIEDLFTQFDGITSEFKKEFEKEKITHSELPKNIDFAKKYYDFPIEFNVESIKK